MNRLHFVGPLAVLGVWFLLTLSGCVDTLFIPKPQSVLFELRDEVIAGRIWGDVLATIYRVMTGFSLGSVFGIALGSIMGRSDKIYYSLEVVVDFSRSLPAVALFPLFLLIFGISESSKIALAAWAAALIVLINTIYGVRSAKKARILAAKSMGANPSQIFRKIIWPNALPEIIAGLRVAVSISLVVVVVAEMFLGTVAGLGLRIYNASMMYRTGEMYGFIIVTGLIGYGLNKIFVVVERKLIHWSGN